MNTKEKALILRDKFLHPYNRNTEVDAKVCAMVAVDEIINLLSIEPHRPSNIYQTHKYWIGVKQELEKL